MSDGQARRKGRRKGLGRIHHPDPRDKDYPLMAVARETAEVPWDQLPTYVYRTPPNPRLDQGETPHCVGYSAKTLLLAGPVRRTGPPTAEEIYYWAESHDPWPDNHEQGTTVRAGARACVYFLQYDEYRWAFSVEEIYRWLVGYGPIIVGSDWREEMFYPDSKGFIHARGPAEDGHAYCISGGNRIEAKFRIANSWGMDWGQDGMCWISWDDLADLLGAGGEAMSPVERKVA